MSGVDLTVIIPVYREAHRIIPTIESVRRFLDARGAGTDEIILVADGPDEAVRDVLRTLDDTRPEIRLITFAENRGKGAAVRAGVLSSRGRRVLFSDVDLSTPIEEAGPLLDAIDEGADIAIASRRLPESDLAVPQGLPRRMAGHAFAGAVRTMTGLDIADTQCGFKMFRGDVARALFAEQREERFAFDVEILCLARERGLRVAEIPVTWRNSNESTVHPLRDGLRMLACLVRLGDPRRLPAVFDRQLVLMLLATLVLTALLRGALSGIPPLFDVTEGRYGSIALQMYESGDWITPRVRIQGDLVPFWAKPPLQFWMGAASYALFGVNEFAARLPALLAGILMLWLVYRAGRVSGGVETGVLSALVLASSVLFLGLWGSVVLDVAASACSTGIVVSWMLSCSLPVRAARPWRYLFFVFIGLGMLAKGPIVLVLGLGAVVLHALLSGRLRVLLRLPWPTGTLVSLAIFAPWYLLAEGATPGFLRYFFVNEHILRFLTPDYGDLYGAAHVRPRGTIWGFMLLGLMPWPLIFAGGAPRAIATLRERLSRPKGWERLFLVAALLPVLFFTPARSVVPTYVLPGLGFAAILIATGVRSTLRATLVSRWRMMLLWSLPILLVGLMLARDVDQPATAPAAFWLFTAAAISGVLLVLGLMWPDDILAVGLLPVVLLCAGVAAWSALPASVGQDNSSHDAVEMAAGIVGGGGGHIYVLRQGEPSMDFYGGDRVRWVRKLDDVSLEPEMDDTMTDAYLLRQEDREKLSPHARSVLDRVATIGDYDIYRDRPGRAVSPGVLNLPASS